MGLIQTALEEASEKAAGLRDNQGWCEKMRERMEVDRLNRLFIFIYLSLA